MSDARSVLDEMRISQAEHLPLVAAFLERMGLAAVINAAVPTEMALDLGSVVALMVPRPPPFPQTSTCATCTSTPPR